MRALAGLDPKPRTAVSLRRNPNLGSLESLSEHRPSALISPVYLERVLGCVQPDHQPQ
jgi:hypothetical protein